jgi:hypothetical protein
MTSLLTRLIDDRLEERLDRTHQLLAYAMGGLIGLTAASACVLAVVTLTAV